MHNIFSYLNHLNEHCTAMIINFIMNASVYAYSGYPYKIQNYVPKVV